MATTTVPDPAALNNWNEVFQQYPLPTVRKLSARLRKDVDEHRARLRALVGASYRDLLGTAERIIDMDKQIQSVELGLNDIGRRCNSGILEKNDTNYSRLERSWARQGGEEEKLRSTAQCKILAAALSVVSKVIRSDGDPLQAAKLMVLTRLLYKSLSEVDDVPAILERQRRTISTLRSKLLAYIDRRLAREETSTDDLTGALSAYALLTSSAPKDVLRHLLAVRIAQLETLASDPTTDVILSALSLYTSSFVSVQSVFPKRLLESLRALSKVTLLSDKHIKSIVELNLDVYGRWISDDIKSFTPWVQQDNLSAQEGRQAMSDFSDDAREILLRGLTACLANVSSSETVLEVRKKVMAASLNISAKVKMDGFAQQLEDFREVFNTRLEALVQHDAVLDDFNVSNVQKTHGTAMSSIWDLAQDDIDLSSGGIHFREAVLRKRNGHDAVFDRVLAPFETWRARIESLWTNIESMRKTRWDQLYERDLEDGEDEETAPYQDLLSNQDAARVQERLHASVKEAITSMHKRLEQTIHNETIETPFYIRLLREVHGQQVELSQLLGLEDAATLLRHDLSSSLHAQLAHTIASHGVEALRVAYTKRHFVPVDLWEGSPRLPLQPLPATFRFVLTIQQEMAKVGEDVWSVAAVKELKQSIQSQLADVLDIEIIVAEQSVPAVNGHEKEETDAETSADGEPVVTSESEANDNDNADDGESEVAAELDKPSMSDEHATGTIDLTLNNIQRLFDGLYLVKVFSTSKSSTLLTKSIETLKRRASLDASDTQRLERNAAEYWKRTYLLFGLLANSSRSYNR